MEKDIIKRSNRKTIENRNTTQGGCKGDENKTAYVGICSCYRNLNLLSVPHTKCRIIRSSLLLGILMDFGMLGVKLVVFILFHDQQQGFANGGAVETMRFFKQVRQLFECQVVVQSSEIL